MNGARVVAIARLGIALLALSAVATRFVNMLDDPFKSPVMFFSEFTYQSNILVAGVFLAGASFLHTHRRTGLNWELVRGSIVTVTATTLVVYQILVEGTRASPDGTVRYAAWAGDALHVWIPLLVLADWLLLPPAIHIPWKRALVWTAFPLLFLGYSLVRGSIVDWYPYDFLDPTVDGWGAVAIYVAVVSAGFLLFAASVLLAANVLSGRWPWSFPRLRQPSP